MAGFGIGYELAAIEADLKEEDGVGDGDTEPKAISYLCEMPRDVRRSHVRLNSVKIRGGRAGKTLRRDSKMALAMD